MNQYPTAKKQPEDALPCFQPGEATESISWPLTIYETLATSLNDGEHTNSRRGRPPGFAFEYVHHAKKDLDAFHSLEESQLINGIYHHLECAQTANLLEPTGPVAHAMFAYGGIHDAADDGGFGALA